MCLLCRDGFPGVHNVQLYASLSSPKASYFFAGVADAAAEDGGEDHTDVFGEGVVTEVVEVDADFVGEDYLVVVSLRIGLFGEQVFLVAVFQGGRARDTGTKPQHVAVLPLQLVGIAGHVGTWTDKAHITDQYVPELRKFIELVVWQ